VLGIAAVLFVSGLFVGWMPGAAADFMAGTLRLAGLGGFILGLFDLFRKQRPGAARRSPPRTLQAMTVTKDNLADLEAVNREMAGARFRFADLRWDQDNGLWEVPFWIGDESAPKHTLTVRGAVDCVHQSMPGLFIYDVGTLKLDAAGQAIRLEGTAPKTVIVRLGTDFSIGVA
jgi:hypothetical protein